MCPLCACVDVPSVHVWHLANEKLSEGSCAYKLRGRSRSSSQARLLPWPEDPKKGEWAWCLGQVASGMLLMVVGNLGNLSRLWIRSHNNAAKKCLQLKFTHFEFEYHKKMPTRAQCVCLHCTMAQAMEIRAIKDFKSTKLIHMHFLNQPDDFWFFANGVEYFSG